MPLIAGLPQSPARLRPDRYHDHRQRDLKPAKSQKPVAHVPKRAGVKLQTDQEHAETEHDTDETDRKCTKIGQGLPDDQSLEAEDKKNNRQDVDSRRQDRSQTVQRYSHEMMLP